MVKSKIIPRLKKRQHVYIIQDSNFVIWNCFSSKKKADQYIKDFEGAAKYHIYDVFVN